MATSTGGFAGMFQGLGWSFGKTKAEKKEEKDIQQQEVVEIENNDASEIIDSTHSSRSVMSALESFKTQAAIVNEYRGMSLHPEVDNAVDDIVNAIVSVDDEEAPVKIDISNSTLSENTKQIINDRFEDLLRKMRFDVTAYEKVKQWYVDGRLVYHVVINPDKPKEGIQKLILLDPRAVKRVKEIKKEPDENGVDRVVEVEDYFIYDGTYSYDNTQNKVAVNGSKFQNASNTFGKQAQKLKMSKDSIAMVHSGILSSDTNMILSHLEKARAALNNLKMMESALVIYRITRAPERRVFYIDVGSLPKKGAEAYMTAIMEKYRTKLTYDPSSGKINNGVHQMSMLEDFWLPRREGGSGTTIDTLPGGENLGQMDDVLYFKRNLYKALNVPQGRLEPDANIILGSRSGEISRDEWKFGKFISRLRTRFSALFDEVLKRDLILRGITTEEDWEELIEPHLRYIFNSDTYLKEQQEIELFLSKVQALETAKPLEGTYFSRETIFQTVFGHTDEEMREERKKIEQEIKDGLYHDPMDLEVDDNGKF